MMTFLFIFCYIIATFGICELIIYFDGPFRIIDRFRNLMHRISDGMGQLVDCFACLSTWVGLILSLIDILCDVNFTPFNLLLDGNSRLFWLIIPLDMAFTCATTWMLHQLEEYLEYRDGDDDYTDLDDNYEKID